MKKKVATKTKASPFRFDTPIETVEQSLGVTLGQKANTTFGEFLQKSGYGSLAKMLQEEQR